TQYGEYEEPIVFQTNEDLRLALVGLYDDVSTEDIISFTSVFTDETAIGISSGGQNIPEYRFQLFATNSFASAIWLQNYSVINTANRIIQGAESVIIEDPESVDGALAVIEQNRILAEVRALRAFAHFQLMTFYSTDLKDDAALGVILLDHVPPVLPNVEELPRSTNGELFNFINADLDYATANLPIGNSNIFVTPNFIRGLRTRIALYRGNYAEALTRANDMITGTLNQGLTPRATYPNIFKPVSGTQTIGEVIFGLERPLNKRGIVSEWYFNEANLAGSPFMEVSRSLYDALRMSPGDIRTSVIVGPESVIAPDYQTVFDYRNEDILLVNKYPGTPPNLPLNNRIPVMRYSEIHLIKAEAQIGTGDLTGALATLNFLRNNRITGAGIMLPAFENATVAWKAVLDERRKELAFEGHRYIDLKRLGTLAGVPGVQRYERDCAPYSACELLVTDNRFTLPIPTDELNG
ncbi:MAG: RagB/SusD family nutrient uptake outer membrane protein, partial [Pedobacter sp.]